MDALLSALSLLVLLACPLMMIFMMRSGHGSRHDAHSDDATASRVAELEREVARLHRERDDEHAGHRAG